MSVWHVYETRGEYEPWWFFEGWESSISKESTFISKENAMDYFIQRIEALKRHNPNVKAKSYSTIAFWKKEEKIFCEACDEDLQLYTGLILMYGDKVYKWNDEEVKPVL
ncbi:DUF1033 family protein [Bacillus spongiae]|uniref:DUF1033 family protein n=1 Tax=Bacillus spongiae TaxID=2683610 RepID=A0ABU8HHN0_9BACI